MNFTETVEFIGKFLDAIGIAIIVAGTLLALAVYVLRSTSKAERHSAYQRGRQDMGRSILLGLEFLVAGDIIRTVATTPTFQNVGVLGLIVLIRTFLSTALEVEVEGRWPWRKDAAAGDSSGKPASS